MQGLSYLWVVSHTCNYNMAHANIILYMAKLDGYKVKPLFIENIHGWHFHVSTYGGKYSWMTKKLWNYEGFPHRMLCHIRYATVYSEVLSYIYKYYFYKLSITYNSYHDKIIKSWCMIIIKWQKPIQQCIKQYSHTPSISLQYTS